MSTAGLSKARLARMHDVMAGYVERGEVPGLVTLVSRRGELHIDVIGTQAIGDSRPMRRDTIFRISSMTKPIIAVATRSLVEECKLRLDEPVDALLPELADRDWLIEYACHRSGVHLREVELPFTRLRIALAKLWLTFPCWFVRRAALRL